MRQSMPVCDQLPECGIRADMVEPLSPMRDTSIMKSTQSDGRTGGSIERT